eukprot:TRINITY_DN96697_c0_g1_i1.p1 TRINITY_DN96697_c0_g1~~TRINITY_DN96697_c0_g1_i1.p1  ORF type:complete len:459 (+),score=91.38 TRINITY_DN96697_c0_g1_i1:155-1378(+)
MAPVSRAGLPWLTVAAASIVACKLWDSPVFLQPATPSAGVFRPLAGRGGAPKNAGALRGVRQAASRGESATSSAGFMAFGAAAALMAAAGLRSNRYPKGIKISMKAHPQTIKIIDMQGEELGEEKMHYACFSRQTANYVVWRCHNIWEYWQKKFQEWFPRRYDVRKGKKPYKQKGSGRARHGTRYSPLFGKTKTNKYPHGLDNRRSRKLYRQEHMKAISTVLQSKWKKIKIVDGLEDWAECRHYEMVDFIEKLVGKDIQKIPPVLLIARNAYGEVPEERGKYGIPSSLSRRSNIYMSGRFIPRLEMRTPAQIDSSGKDALHQALRARRVIISREAWHDLDAKFHHETGWAWKDKSKIYLEQLQKLAKEYPFDREAEYEAAAALPPLLTDREFWAKEQREKIALEAAK